MGGTTSFSEVHPRVDFKTYHYPAAALRRKAVIK
jgi:hypothetical protein